MYKYCFIMASVSTRQHLLNKFIDSARESKYCNADYYLYYQQISDDQILFDRTFFKQIHYSRQRDGVCLSRMYWLHMLDNYDFYIIVDDDMEFLGKEDFETMMNFSAATNDCGLICGEYKNRRMFFDKAVAKNQIVVMNMQFIEGGTVIKKSIRDLLIKEIPLKRFAFDTFCITTFINGFTNYQYRGSIVLHKVTNGNQGFAYVARHSDEFEDDEDLFKKYMRQIKYEDGYLRLPKKEKDLTDEAFMLHNENQKKVSI